MSVFALFAVAAFGVAYIGPLSASTTQAEAAELDPLSLYAGTIADALGYVGVLATEWSSSEDGKTGLIVAGITGGETAAQKYAEELTEALVYDRDGVTVRAGGVAGRAGRC